MSDLRYTASTITDDALDQLYERLRKAERAANLLAVSHRRAKQAEEHAAIYRAAWHSARRRARVMSDELTRRAPLTGQYATAIERVQQACHELPYEYATRVLTALDGTEQPKESTTP